MVQFPETARAEWQSVVDLIDAEIELRKRIQRGTRVEDEAEKLRVRHEATLKFQQELDAESTPTLEMGTMAELMNVAALAPPADLIEGVIKDSGVCLVLGPSESGKSTLAMQMIHSLTTGDDWLGQTAKPLSGGFGVMSYDMDYRMLGAILQKYPGMDFSRVSLVQAYKQGNPLGVPEIRSQIVAAWKRVNTEVVIIDSFSASFFGHDQNDAASTMAHYRDLKKFALTEVGAKILIVIVHSTESNPDKVRGSTVHHDVADSIVGVSVNNDDSRTVKMIKYRAAPGQEKMQKVIVTPPDSVTHLVSLDPGAMALAGIPIPASVGADIFPDMPEPEEAPDIESEEEDDL